MSVYTIQSENKNIKVIHTNLNRSVYFKNLSIGDKVHVASQSKDIQEDDYFYVGIVRGKGYAYMGFARKDDATNIKLFVTDATDVDNINEGTIEVKYNLLGKIDYQKDKSNVTASPIKKILTYEQLNEIINKSQIEVLKN